MSELGEYWQDKRLKDQVKKLHKLNWNTDVVFGLCEELQFKVTKHSEVHFSLYRKDNKRMDFWPSTGKAMWFDKKRPGKSFHIPDIEAFLIKNFKPKQ